MSNEMNGKKVKNHSELLSTLLQNSLLQGSTNNLRTIENTEENILQDTVENVDVELNTVGDILQNQLGNVGSVQNTLALVNTISLMSITSNLDTILTKLSKRL